jgi:GAF domain-containing protein
MRDDRRFVEHGPLLQLGLRAVLSVPLRTKGNVIGTLNVGSRQVGRYTEEDSELLLAIADQVVLAIQNLLAYERSRRSSNGSSRRTSTCRKSRGPIRLSRT